MSVKARASEWYRNARLREDCSSDTRCKDAEPNGNCDTCDTMDGRFIEAVSEYASTCDGECMELTHHHHLYMDPETQLGYCQRCIPKMPEEVQGRVREYYKEQTGRVI